MNGLCNVLDVLEKCGTGYNEIHIDEAIRARAKLPIDRMLDFAQQVGVTGKSSVDSRVTKGIGPA